MVEAEGWVVAGDAKFIETTIRGAFIPARHALFLYRGVGFFFDDEVIEQARCRAADLMAALTLDPEVGVHVGPADAVVRGATYEQRQLGTIGSLLQTAPESR
jgi:hypothetical protein